MVGFGLAVPVRSDALGPFQVLCGMVGCGEAWLLRLGTVRHALVGLGRVRRVR